MKETVDEITKFISQGQVKALNEIFSHNTPKTLALGMEIVVAILRNHTNATNIDVELYFSDYTKLVLKM